MILILEHGIGAKVFIKMTEEEICDPELGFTFGGKKTLKGVWKMIKVYIALYIIKTTIIIKRGLRYQLNFHNDTSL